MHINELLAQTISLRDKTQANNPNSQRLSILERDIQRLKRMAAGERRVEVWLSADDYAWLKQMARCESVSDVLSWCVGKARSERWEVKP